MRNEVGRGAIFLYIQLISSMITGYIFLILLARITTTEIIGTFSLLVSISEIFANLAIIGLPDSIQKFVGKSFLQNNRNEAKLFVKISLVFLSVGITGSCLVILSAKDWLSSAFGLDFGLIIVINLLIASYSVFSVLYSVVIASLRTKVLPIIIVISSVCKVVMALAMVLSGYGVLGLALGYTFFGQTLSSALLAIFIYKTYKITKSLTKPLLNVREASKNLLTGGMVAWVPILITTVGIDLGTLVLYNTHGPDQSGVYFIALALANGVNAIVFAVFTVSLPVLSSMQDGRKKFAWQTIRISSIMALPLASSIIFYSGDIMQLIGSNYENGSISLQILLLSSFPIIVMTGVENLVFSYGKYRYSLAITIGTSIPRTALYFILVPIFGVTGVAMSFTIGSVIGFIVSILTANSIGMSIFWRPLALTLFLPMFLAYLLKVSHVNPIIGIIATIIASYLILIKLHIVAKSDGSFLIGLMPGRLSELLIITSNKFRKIIDWFYD